MMMIAFVFEEDARRNSSKPDPPRVGAVFQRVLM
jgi:hypothetical protein